MNTNMTITCPYCGYRGHYRDVDTDWMGTTNGYNVVKCESRGSTHPFETRGCGRYFAALLHMETVVTTYKLDEAPPPE